MDFYKSIDELKTYFLNFIKKNPSFGKSFICIDDEINNQLVKEIKNKNFYTYGQKSNSNFKIKNIKQFRFYSEFDIQVCLPNKKKFKINKIKIPLLGIHNIRNSVGALECSIHWYSNSKN